MKDNSETISFLLGNTLVTPAYVASTTQAQGNGPIVYGTTIVTTVGSDNDAITLPAAAVHKRVTLVNDDAAQHLELWPASGDSIGDGAVDASIIVGPKQSITFVAKDATNWLVISSTDTVEDDITAFAGGGQANATLIRSSITRVGIVATNGDSVKLPPANPGLMVALYNDDSGQYCEVFANDDTTDRINDYDATEGIILTPNTGVIFYCISNALWHTFGRELPYVNGFAASAIQSQGEAPVRQGFTRITSVSSNGDAITLPGAYVGNECTLFNNDAAQNCQVFPASGNSINALGTDQPFMLFPGQIVNFKASSAANWYAPPASLPGVVSGIIANGNVIGTATQLLGDWNVVATSTASDNAVQLPVGYIGRKVWILNDDSADAVLVFPKSGSSAQINDLAIDASITLAAKSSVELRAVTATKWKT